MKVLLIQGFGKNNKWNNKILLLSSVRFFISWFLENFCGFI